MKVPWILVIGGAIVYLDRKRGQLGSNGPTSQPGAEPGYTPTTTYPSMPYYQPAQKTTIIPQAVTDLARGLYRTYRILKPKPTPVPREWADMTPEQVAAWSRARYLERQQKELEKKRKEAAEKATAQRKKLVGEALRQFGSPIQAYKHFKEAITKPSTQEEAARAMLELKRAYAQQGLEPPRGPMPDPEQVYRESIEQEKAAMEKEWAKEREAKVAAELKRQESEIARIAAEQERARKIIAQREAEQQRVPGTSPQEVWARTKKMFEELGEKLIDKTMRSSVRQAVLDAGGRPSDISEKEMAALVAKTTPMVKAAAQQAVSENPNAKMRDLLREIKRKAGAAVAPEASALVGASQIKRKLGDFLGDEKVQEVTEKLKTHVNDLLTSGVVTDAEQLNDPAVEKEIGMAAQIEAMKSIREKAATGQLTPEQLIKLDKMRQKEQPSVPKLRGDVTRLEDLRMIELIKPKLHEETYNAQEEGWAPLTVGGKTKYIKIKDDDDLMRWRRQRAEQLAAQYREKNAPKIAAEKQAVREEIASRSPTVAKMQEMITRNALEMAPRMAPTGWNEQKNFESFVKKYGSNVRLGPKGELVSGDLTTDSYRRLIADYEAQWKGKDKSGTGGMSTGDILGMVKRDVDVLAPAFLQAADPSLDQRERYDRLKNFAQVLDALSVELAERHVPLWLAGKSDAEVMSMMRGNVIKGIDESLPALEQQYAARRMQLAEQAQRAVAGEKMYQTLEKAMLAPGPVYTIPLYPQPPMPGTPLRTIQGIDEIAAMEFGRR